MKLKEKYSVNSSNRLVVKRGKSRVTPDGRFSVDNHNRLLYWLNEPKMWRAKNQLPSKIAFLGKWQIDKNHDLELLINKNRERNRVEELSLKGEIISCEANRIVFQLASLDKKGCSHFRLFSLFGHWQVDNLNRITFLVRKTVRPDILTLNGTWSLNRNQQIVYRYEKVLLKRKVKIVKTLLFKGYWQINNRNRLTYILSKTLNSIFDFRAQIESPNLYPAKGLIKYRLGIGLKETGIKRDRIIFIYGTWKFRKNMVLAFEIDYGKYGIRQIEFTPKLYLTKRDSVELSLLNKREEPLGLRIILNHRFLKEYPGEAFLRLKSLAKEKRVDAGLKLRF